MDKRVLLIGETVGFMMNAIINGLKKEEYEVEEVTAKIGNVGKLFDIPKIVILYLDAELAADSEFLVYLKDIVIEKELSLFVVGNDQEIEEIVGFIPEEIVTRKVLRPLNVKELAGYLDAEVERGRAA